MPKIDTCRETTADIGRVTFPASLGCIRAGAIPAWLLLQRKGMAARAREQSALLCSALRAPAVLLWVGVTFSDRSLTGGCTKGLCFTLLNREKIKEIPILPTDRTHVLCTLFVRAGRFFSFLYLGIFEVNDVVTLG